MFLSSYTSLPDTLLEYWHKQQHICNDRNKDWFNNLIQDHKRYELFTVMSNNNDIVSFSLVQMQGFPKYTARIGTRTFIDPKYRNKTSSLEKNKKTIIFQMLREQYSWVKQNNAKENCFSSIEFGKTAAIKSCAKKFQQILINFIYKVFTVRN